MLGFGQNFLESYLITDYFSIQIQLLTFLIVCEGNVVKIKGKIKFIFLSNSKLIYLHHVQCFKIDHRRDWINKIWRQSLTWTTDFISIFSLDF